MSQLLSLWSEIKCSDYPCQKYQETSDIQSKEAISNLHDLCCGSTYPLEIRLKSSPTSLTGTTL